MKYEITVEDNEKDSLIFSVSDNSDGITIMNIDGEDLLFIKDYHKFINTLSKLVSLKEQQ